jgi:hypothetical protein
MRSRCQYLGVVVVTSVSGVFGVLLFYLNTKHAKQDLEEKKFALRVWQLTCANQFQLFN